MDGGKAERIGEGEEAGVAPVLELELVALDMGLHFVEVLQALPADQVECLE